MPATSSAGCCCKACAGHFIGWLFYCKACAGHFTCWLFLLQGLCRPTSFAGCLLQQPCHAMPCLPTFAMTHVCCRRFILPRSVLHFSPPVHYHVRQDHRANCRDCSDGSCNTGLHRRPVHRLFVHCIHLKGGGLELRLSSLAPCYNSCFLHRIHRSWAMV